MLGGGGGGGERWGGDAAGGAGVGFSFGGWLVGAFGGGVGGRWGKGDGDGKVPFVVCFFFATFAIFGWWEVAEECFCGLEGTERFFCRW